MHSTERACIGLSFGFDDGADVGVLRPRDCCASGVIESLDTRNEFPEFAHWLLASRLVAEEQS